MKWVDVKDELPQDGQGVFVAMYQQQRPFNGSGEYKAAIVYKTAVYKNHGTFVIDGQGYLPVEIEAWAPIPPYKPVS